MKEVDFNERAQALGPSGATQIERLRLLATDLGYTLVPAEGRDEVVDEAWVASGQRLAAHHVYLRIVASRKLGVSRAFVETHLASKLEIQVAKTCDVQGAASGALWYQQSQTVQTVTVVGPHTWFGVAKSRTTTTPRQYNGRTRTSWVDAPKKYHPTSEGQTT